MSNHDCAAVSDTLRAVVVPGCKHDVQEVYYGTRCRKCGEFYPSGCAPWDEPEDDRPADDWCRAQGEEWDDFSDCPNHECDGDMVDYLPCPVCDGDGIVDR